VIRICAAVIALIGMSIGTPASAGNVSDIGRLLTRAPLICGTFTQSKTLAALTRPLVSTGKVIFASDTGVLWQITSPFPSQALVKEDALIRWDSENVPKRSGFGQTPQFRALSDVFFAVFAGDTNRLAASFDTAANIGSESWSLNLKPRDSEFASRISSIYVSGGRFVEELKITEGQGDRTDIQFKNLSADGCVLSAAETDSLAQ
jgi:outer membrane lipoprotein-sorting protein